MTKRLKLPPILNEAVRTAIQKPSTRQYPLVKIVPPTGFRGKQIFDIELCISCGLCARDCPAKAIEMVEVEEKKRPLFHLDRCIFCCQCIESCPRNAIKASEIFEMASLDKNTLVLKPQSTQSTIKAPKI